MKLASRKAVNTSEQRRVRLLADRARATPLRDAFPELRSLRIDLRYADHTAQPLSPQVLTLYPSARAFFRFSCPCSGCDGEFDLTAAVRAFAETSRPTRSRAPQVREHVKCQGTRSRYPNLADACTMELDYQLSTHALESAS